MPGPQMPTLTVDISVFTVQDDALHVLLVKRSNPNTAEYGKWALPGGYILTDKDQNLDEAAYRVLTEKTQAKVFLEQVGSFGNADRDPRGWFLSVLYFALEKQTDIKAGPGRDTSESRWFAIDEARALDLAFDHEQLLQAAFERLQNKTAYTALPVRLMPETFTLGELQKVYETIMEKPLEKKSFRRRIEGADILEYTGQQQHAGSRPASLYRIKPGFTGYTFNRLLEGKGTR